LIIPRGSSLDKTVVFGVRESNLYRIKGKPMRAMDNSGRATEDKEQVEQIKGSQPLGSSGKEQPSKSLQKKQVLIFVASEQVLPQRLDV
jgi:hypothetical protein